MNVFFEKADQMILNECETFIQNNSSAKATYFVFREALHLYTRLSQSLLDSHKDFDNAIKHEVDKFIALEEDISREAAIIKFNQANYCLVLDAKAHKTLEELEKIQRNNRTK
jgi:hypothetical protein